MSSCLGITFSSQQLKQLGIPIKNALQTALAFNFSHIRLGAYWNQIETKPSCYDFSELKEILFRCQKKDQAVVVTLGVKAPRWPEFYWPDFITIKNTDNLHTQKFILNFIQKTIHELKSFTCITHWQIENEPFDLSGPDQLKISESFLKKEITIVKNLDQRPIIINFSITLFSEVLANLKKVCKNNFKKVLNRYGLPNFKLSHGKKVKKNTCLTILLV